MDRRELMLGGALGAGALAMGARAEAASPTGGHHGKHYEPANAAFRKQAEECLSDGHACLDHCLVLLGGGDATMADCAKIVKQMIAVCAAAGPVASTGSKHVKTLAKLCHDVCVDCKKECDVHAKKHPICKQCSQSCERMIREAKKLV
ncbi:MAG: four-helix bundle copper-binding protein [Myxococcota bacterium]